MIEESSLRVKDTTFDIVDIQKEINAKGATLEFTDLGHGRMMVSAKAAYDEGLNDIATTLVRECGYQSLVHGDVLVCSEKEVSY